MPIFIRDKKFIILLIITIGFALYAFNLHGKLFWDEDDWIVNNPYVHSFSWQNLKFIFSHDTLAGIGLRSNYYRPFMFLTFMANYIVSGTRPLIYHLTNNFIHIFNAVLLFFLLDKFLRKRTVAAIASLLFLIHPLQTEAVTYISGRGDPLSVALMLLSLLFFLKSQSTSSSRFYSSRSDDYKIEDPRSLSGSGQDVDWKDWRKWLSLGFLILALLTRETAFLFPLYLMIFLMAFVYYDRFWVSFKKSLVKALPYFGISLLYGVSRLTFLNFQNTLNFFQQSNVYTEHLSYRIYTFLHVILVYLKLIFVPTGLHMERDVAVNVSLFQWPVWAGALLIIGLVFVLFWLYRRERSRPLTRSDLQAPVSTFRIWFFAWGFFFLNLAPTSGIFPINALLYEHWLYFSLFGFFTLLAFYLDVIFNFLRSKIRPLFYVAVILFSAYLVFLGVQTVRRNVLWGKIDKFYENILYYEPQSVRVLNNLANYYSDNGRLKDAEDLYWRAVDAKDVQPAPYYNLGNILVNREDYAGAIELYKKAIEVDPSFPYAYTNLAVLYAQQGSLTEALKYLKQLVTIRPADPLTYYNIAQLESALGRKNEAIETLKTGLKYAAGSPDIEAEINKFLENISK